MIVANRFCGNYSCDDRSNHDDLGGYELHCENTEEFLFTENESNFERLWGVPNRSPFVKDSINNAVIQDRIDFVNSDKVGTKAAAHYKFTIPANEITDNSFAIVRVVNPVEGGVPATPGSQQLAPPVRPAVADNHPSPGDAAVPLSQTHSSSLTGASRPSLPREERVRAQHPSMISMKSLPRARPKPMNSTASWRLLR